MNELSLFNSLFDNAFDCGMPDLTWKTARLPKVDIKENKDSYSLQMDLPRWICLEPQKKTLTSKSTTAS